MTKKAKGSVLTDLNQQGARALLTATFEFLRVNNISEQSIADFVRKPPLGRAARSSSRKYDKLMRAFEDMGIIMATWFSDPHFLDASGTPLPLSKGSGAKSLTHLIRVSRANVETAVALRLMKQSPSIKVNSDGNLVALRRVFVLPELEVPRAAFIVERYLTTLQQNAAARRKQTKLLLERSCHASEIDLTKIAPLLRDIESRGTAFMDSIDGEIEGRRLRRANGKAVGETGVVVFAWTKAGDAKVRPT